MRYLGKSWFIAICFFILIKPGCISGMAMLAPLDTLLNLFRILLVLYALMVFAKNMLVLPKFDVITVREDTGASLIKELTGQDCPVVVDPTLLLTANQWVDLLKIEQPLIQDKYVLAYFIGAAEEHRKKARAYAQTHNLKLIILPNIDEIVQADTEYADEPLYDAGPDDFVNLIKNAEAVFTDSFH